MNNDLIKKLQEADLFPAPKKAELNIRKQDRIKELIQQAELAAKQRGTEIVKVEIDSPQSLRREPIFVVKTYNVMKGDSYVARTYNEKDAWELIAVLKRLVVLGGREDYTVEPGTSYLYPFQVEQILSGAAL